METVRFLCIGPEKTGTSWLYRQLIYHPEVFVPNYKEINYFLKNRVLVHNNIFKRLFSPYWYYRSIRRYMCARVKNYLKSIGRLEPIDTYTLGWDLRFFFCPRTDRWYKKITFKKGRKAVGEVAPLYAYLRDSDIGEIRRLFPDLKVIILLRNPVDRLWSKAKMNLLQLPGRDISQVSDDEFYSHFKGEVKMLPCYVELIDRWAIIFPPKNIHVNFYDKIVAQPLEFLAEVSAFLGIDGNRFPPEISKNLRQKANEGLSLQIPAKFAHYLAGKYKEPILRLSRRYDIYPQQWLMDIDKILSR
jgi:hypothetical protein